MVQELLASPDGFPAPYIHNLDKLSDDHNYNEINTHVINFDDDLFNNKSCGV